MNAYDWTWVAAVCGFVVAFVSYCHRGDDRQWRESTGSSPQTVAEHVAELRKAHEIEQLEAWLHAPSQPRNTIPHQTRRTEEDQ